MGVLSPCLHNSTTNTGPSLLVPCSTFLNLFAAMDVPRGAFGGLDGGCCRLCANGAVDAPPASWTRFPRPRRHPGSTSHATWIHVAVSRITWAIHVGGIACLAMAKPRLSSTGIRRHDRNASPRRGVSSLPWDGRRNSEGPRRRRARCRARPCASCGFARLRMRRWMLDVQGCGIRGARSMLRRLHLLTSSNFCHTIHDSHARWETIPFTFPSARNPRCASKKSNRPRLPPIGTLPTHPSIHPLVKVNGVAF